MSAATLISIFGALGVGSLLTQAVAGAGDRRRSRADFLRALGVAEQSRWFPLTPGEPTPAESLRSLQAAALVAGIRREPLDFYVVICRAAGWLSSESWDENPDPEYGGGISSEFANIATASASLLADVAWQPRRSRWRWRKRRDEIQARIDAVESTSAQRLYRQSADRPSL